MRSPRRIVVDLAPSDEGAVGDSRLRERKSTRPASYARIGAPTLGAPSRGAGASAPEGSPEPRHEQGIKENLRPRYPRRGRPLCRPAISCVAPHKILCSPPPLAPLLGELARQRLRGRQSWVKSRVEKTEQSKILPCHCEERSDVAIRFPLTSDVNIRLSG